MLRKPDETTRLIIQLGLNFLLIKKKKDKLNINLTNEQGIKTRDKEKNKSNKK